MSAKKTQPLQIVAMARAPIDRLFDTAVMKCTVCKALMGTCDCWTKCSCGWSFRKGKKCRNPAHKSKP